MPLLSTDTTNELHTCCMHSFTRLANKELCTSSATRICKALQCSVDAALLLCQYNLQTADYSCIISIGSGAFADAISTGKASCIQSVASRSSFCIADSVNGTSGTPTWMTLHRNYKSLRPGCQRIECYLWFSDTVTIQ